MKPDRLTPVLMFAGSLLLPIIWLGTKYGFAISDRYLPSPDGVLAAALVLEPSVVEHFLASATRLVASFPTGLFAGIVVGCVLHASPRVRTFFEPMLVSLQVVPPIATAPFFILWFGFAEVGKFLIVFLATSVTMALVTLRTLAEMEERYRIFEISFPLPRPEAISKLYFPYAVQRVLPTVRYSLSIAVGLVLFSELLGAQLGLGYLIQTARSTFSMNTVFLAGLLSTILYVIADWAVIQFWKYAFPWSAK